MNKLKKTANIFLALLLIVAASGYWFAGRALAVNGILDTRSIQMSSSASGATKVQYSVKFNIGTTGNVGGLVIDFCTEDPLPGDACTAPASFSANKATIGDPLNQVGITNWTLDTTDSTNQHLILTRTAASITAGTTVSFNLGNGTSSGITNPATINQAFYARIFTYAATGGGSGYSSGSPGTYVDFGGVALTTTATLSITAKVEEQITLCVYVGSCGSSNASITLGDSVTGALDVSHSYTNADAKFNASTNASNGMTIYAKGSTLTSNQGNTIAAIGATAQSSSTGTEQFGFCVSKSGGSVTASSPYNNANCSTATTGKDTAGTAQFAFDSTNLSGLTGQAIASSAGPSTTTTGTLAFLANISPTTKSGSYTTTMTFIGVGSY